MTQVIATGPEPVQAVSSPAPSPRRLTGLERAMRITDDFVPFNVVVVLRLEGRVPPAALRSALDALQHRHPLLRAGAIGPASKPFFRFETAGQIPLEVQDRPSAESWIAVAEEELARRFNLEAGPLLRCRYLAGPSGGDVVLTFQHMIVDATSAVRLIQDFLTLCAGGTVGDGSEIAAEGKVPATELFPPDYKGGRLARAVAAFMGRQFADEMWFRWHSRGVRKPPIAPKGNCRILPIRFSADLTSALIRASRKRRITMNSILGAGLIAALQRVVYRGERAPLRHLVFADLRPRLANMPPERMLGCFLTMVRISVMVERDGDLWALAKDIQDATLRAERSGERFIGHALSPPVIKMVLTQKMFRWAATAFSYSGPPDLPLEYGSFALTGVHAFPSNWTTGPEYSALARLFRGELYWDILYLDCDMDAATAQDIANDLEKILREATC